jgi:hypothetical protein
VWNPELASGTTARTLTEVVYELRADETAQLQYDVTAYSGKAEPLSEESGLHAGARSPWKPLECRGVVQSAQGAFGPQFPRISGSNLSPIPVAVSFVAIEVPTAVRASLLKASRA